MEALASTHVLWMYPTWWYQCGAAWMSIYLISGVRISRMLLIIMIDNDLFPLSFFLELFKIVKYSTLL
jgi:hypothetical protein